MMLINLDWDTVETIGIEYVKESYVALLETFHGYDSDNRDDEAELMKDEWRIECFETVLKYILPEGESNAFITEQKQKHLYQTDLFR